ncbi:patatin-like phospholipase family protein [Roseibium sp. CAU 1637]|uniref:Patatin-like phospholipase family protein n=1 Tax=Roseibium limicola TaxID=2816037 RepID=A0A939JAP4_9HYPH|nr:patatin-like phospholipase family protein [Roseibium limicola]MBO0346643.1 patatin-like phospholipase family protein [Roseibium limicola]
MAQATNSTTPKPVNLALQGGGAHGAFTWGVLDRLLEDDRLWIEGVTGTSAGAMNAVVLAAGFQQGGRDGAREKLEEFWKAVSESAAFSPIKRSPLDMALGQWSLDFSPSYLAFDLISRFSSPYEFNPLNINPLREVVEAVVDFERVQACDNLKLFVAATNVFTGKIRIFREKEVTLDAVMASACLPHIFQAVEIDGEPYWDGGYMGNPPLYPLFYSTKARDILLVQINPVERREVPKTAREILNRQNEITFNSTLLRELRAIQFVTRLLEENKLSEDQYKRIYMHRIAGDELKPLTSSSKANAEWAFLTELKEIGRRSAQTWIDTHQQDLGKRNTIDLRSTLE